MEQENNKSSYKKDDMLNSIRAASVDEALDKIREMLLEKEKNIPEGVPHTIWILGSLIQWDYFH